MKKPTNQSFGKLGEKKAVDFLQTQGYQILNRNFQTKYGEIDIIAKDGDCLVFVEVKARSSRRFAHPAQAVNWKKVQHIVRVGEIYLEKNGLDCPQRIDIVSIFDGQIEHFKNVTW